MALLLALASLPLLGCDAQSLFGPIVPSGPVSDCPLASYERRAGEVQEVCCADGCPNGLPEQCNLDCAVRTAHHRRRHTHTPQSHPHCVLRRGSWCKEPITSVPAPAPLPPLP